MIDSTEYEAHLPLDEIPNISIAIQQSLYYDTLYDSIGFICQWEEYRRKKDGRDESCYGNAVASLLKIYGIDITKIAKQ